jgi:ribonucleoside-triphosphate reductase
MNVIKKDLTKEPFNDQKIVDAVNKSASRVMVNLSNDDYKQIIDLVWDNLIEDDVDEEKECTVEDLHNAVESALEEFNPKIAKSYKDYRNYKKDFIHMMDQVYANAQKIRYIGDKDNANTDSALVATKRSLIFNSLNKELYQKFFMTVDERQACKDGYIYIHDMSARLDTMNCFRRDTRFITELGVKSFYDFKDGDTIRVLTHKGNWKNAVVRSYGWQPINKVTLKRAAGKSKDIYCTANHRWILKDGTETTNLKIGDKLIAAPDITNYEWSSLTKLEKLLWCIGFGIADGSIVQDNSIPIMMIRLCGHKKDFAYRFEDIGYIVTYPNSLNGDGQVRMYDIHTKELPWMILNAENVRYLIDGFMSADGNKSSSDNYKYRGIQVTGDFNKYIYDLLNIAGQYVSSTRDLTGEETNYGIRKQTTITYQTCSNQGDRTWFVEDIKKDKLNSKSKVWCLEVEDDHSFILEGGIPTGNCCLFRVGEVMRGGFEMGNVWYNEPNSLDTAFDVMGDIILSTAAQQYGGFTVPEVDKILAPYAEKSYIKYRNEFLEWCDSNFEDKADDYATQKVKRDFEQGWQGIEYKLNTVGSSRGDYPFVTMTFGLDTSKFGKMASITFLNVHKEGQGKEGFKRPVLFPKLVFLYDKNLHGEGCINEDVFNAGIDCSMKTMYPDWLSLTGEGYVPSMYKKYGTVVSPMGCRAFLSPWYERGGMEPEDENDKAIFEGRFNLGAISLHLPMILAKARQESKDFYEVLDYYLEMIRNLHKRTYDYIGELKASVNPVAYCEGGFYGGYLKPDEKIKPILKPMTLSFGITALNELQELYNGKSIAEDGQFALEVMEYINKKLAEYKKEDGLLYAIYGTPAESLCGLQIEQFRKKYGIIEGVSDRTYVSNSFHCHVTEDISPIEKQDLENRFWNLFNGGKIQYCRYPISYNKEAVVTLIRRAMDMGLYEGVNLSLAYCEDCGHEQLDMDVCPVCGSHNITKVDRIENPFVLYK